MRRERFDARDVIGGAIGAILVGAEIDADDAGRAGARRQPPGDRVEAIAIEAETVDPPLVASEAKHPRPRIPWLGFWRHPARLDEAEAEPEQRIRHFGVLVEAGREADRIR